MRRTLKTSLHIHLFLAVLYVCCFRVWAAEDYKDWNYSQKILLNTSSSGADILNNVYNYPLLLRLAPDNFHYFSQTLDSGADLRFAKTDGTQLSYQIEKWVDDPNDNDTAAIWILMDTVYGNNATQSFIMYWGKADAADSSNSAAVFDSGNGFAATYHFSGNLDDATEYERNGNDESTGTDDEPNGLIGSARRFDGSQYFHIDQLPDRPEGTISCWIRPDNDFDNSSTTTQGIWGVRRNDSYNASLGFRGTDYHLGNEDRTGAIQIKAEYDNTSVYLAGETNSFDADRWYYVTWVWGNEHEYLYLNSNLESEIDTSQLVGSTNAYDVIGACYFDSGNINDEEIRYFRGTLDEFCMSSTTRSLPWIRLSYQNQKPSQSLVTVSGVFTWDSDTSSGIQPDDGTWGEDDYWTQNETQLTAWPGRGYTAQFSGNTGTYDISVTDTQLVESIEFLSNTFTLDNGVLDFGTSGGRVHLGNGITTYIRSEITGSNGLIITRSSGSQRSHLYLQGANTYTGVTTLQGNLWCNISVLDDGGTACAFGPVSNAAANLVLDGGALRYVGDDDASTDRLFTVTPRNGYIYVSGTGTLDFTNTGEIAFSGNGDRNVEFGGLLAEGENTFAPKIGNPNSGETSVTTTGAAGCAWIFSADHSYTGPTIVDNGTLIVNGSLHEDSYVIVNDDATLSGNGSIGGPVTVVGTIEPGHNGPGKLSTGTLDLSTTSVLNFELGTQSDTLEISGDFSLNGTINITAGTGFTTGTYTIISWSGGLTDSGVVIGNLPTAVNGILKYSDNTLSIQFTEGLIKLEPEDTIVTIGEAVHFSVTAQGTGDLTYEWRRLPGESVVGNEATYTIGETTVSDTNAQFYCIVTDEASTIDTSRTALLTIINTPHITGLSSDTTVLVGEAATLSITVADTVQCSYEWWKTDSSEAISTENSYEINVATLSDSGDYYCLVSNPAGTIQSDTIHLSVSYAAPIARFTFTPTEGRLPLEVSFFDSSSGRIDSRLWDFGDEATDSSTNPKHVYTTSGFYTVTLTIEGIGGKDTCIASDSITVTGSKNNPLDIQGLQVEARYVAITITNIDQIDTLPPQPWCDSIGIWIAPDAFPENSDEAILLQRYRRSDFHGATLVDTLTFPGTDSVFGMVAGIFWDDGTISDFLESNGMMIDLRDSAKQPNPLVVQAEPLQNMRADITIDNVSRIDTAAPPPYCDSIGIWVAPDVLPTDTTGTILYRRYPRSGFTGDIIHDILELPTKDSIYGIMTGLFYHDGTISDFYNRNGTIIDFRDTSGSSDTKTEPETSIGITITSLTYDSGAAAIRISWCLDTSSDADPEVGIMYGFNRYPEEMNNGQTIAVLDSCTDTIVQLSETLLFDTTYHISLFIRTSKQAAWSSGGDGAKGTVRTGKMFRQVVNYFDTDAETDTVSAFNNTIVLWKDSTILNTSTTVDTLELYEHAVPDGFIVAGTAFSFVEAKNRPAFYIGFHVTVPENHAIDEVRVYRDSAGLMLVEHATLIDSTNGIVYITADDLSHPLIPLIDTEKPSVTFLNDLNTIVHVGDTIIDSVEISDNTANVVWKYLYSRGDRLPSVRDNSELNDTIVVHALTIPSDAQVINSDYGFRAQLIISDGLFKDTFDLSRPVYRDESDPQRTTAMQWQPIYPTAQLYGSNPDSLIISKIDTGTKKYNTRLERLFRWMNTDDTHGNDTDKWVEYNPSNNNHRKLFSIEPGKLLWLKTRKAVNLSFGPAQTLSMTDTFSIKLPPYQFTDIGMPYRFGVALSDIFSASGDDAETVHVLEWTQDKQTGRYRCEPLYMPDISDKHDASVVLQYRSGGGYCIYNPLDTAIDFRIPPTLGTKDATPKVSKKAAVNDWCFKLIGTGDDGYRYPVLYCGYSSGLVKSSFPMPPSFEKLRISLYDRNLSKRQAHYVAEDAANGIIKEIQFENRSDSLKKVHFRIASTGAIPENFSSHLFNNEKKSFQTSGAITLQPHSTVSRWITAGDQALRDHFLSGMGNLQYSLHKLYPNPARSLLHIGYTVPLDAKERLTITIFDLRGRKIWEQRTDKLLSPGVHHTTWNGRNKNGTVVSAGMYTVLFTVSDQNGSTIRRFERFFTYLP